MATMARQPRAASGRNLVQLIRAMRRLVREEFGVTVPLAEEEMPEALLLFAARTQNRQLRANGQRLAALLAADAGPPR